MSIRLQCQLKLVNLLRMFLMHLEEDFLRIHIPVELIMLF